MKILHIDTETQAPEFVVAAAKEVQQEPYWPGKDYPDREVWLAKRAAQRVKPQAQRVYTGRQPMALGINNAKRLADGDGNPKHVRSKKIVQHRHEYYHKRYGEAS